MSGSNSNTPPGANGGDPSMEDILASIRRILAEDEPTAEAAPQPSSPASANGAKATPVKDDVLVLDSSMLAPAQSTPPAPPPVAAAPPPAAPAPVPSAPVQPATNGARNGAAAQSMNGAAPPPRESVNGTGAGHGQETGQPLVIRNTLPCFEDVVREAMRPFIQQWLDATLPKLVERLVRTEVERVVGGSVQ
jgi:cell pole-organizing protein PopZ